eukprot:jgi/Pico_ML_1/55507/g1182.t1
MAPLANEAVRNEQAREFHGGAPSFAAGVTTTDDVDTVTGLEKHELDYEAKGVDIFAEDYAWIHAPPGTIEKPVVVTSDFTQRIVGVTDPEDDNSVIWGVVREGEPPKQIVEDGEYFILKRN